MARWLIRTHAPVDYIGRAIENKGYRFYREGGLFFFRKGILRLNVVEAPIEDIVRYMEKVKVSRGNHRIEGNHRIVFNNKNINTQDIFRHLFDLNALICSGGFITHFYQDSSWVLERLKE